MKELSCKICGVTVGCTEYKDEYEKYSIDCYCEDHFHGATVECDNCGLMIGDIPIDDLDAAGWVYDGYSHFCPDCAPEDFEEED